MKLNEIEEGQFAYVEWVDSCSPGGVWSSPKDIKDVALTCHTIGKVMKNCENHVTLAGTWTNDKECYSNAAGLMTIPVQAVITVELIEGFDEL